MIVEPWLEPVAVQQLDAQTRELLKMLQLGALSQWYVDSTGDRMTEVGIINWRRDGPRQPPTPLRLVKEAVCKPLDVPKATKHGDYS